MFASFAECDDPGSSCELVTLARREPEGKRKNCRRFLPLLLAVMAGAASGHWPEWH